MPGEKILVVDDCETIREIVGDILREAGFKPFLAPDGATGIEMAQSKTPDLVLLDFIMPKMNGLRFCQVMRGIENLKNVPVILMSVKAGSIGEKFMQLVDVVDTISKPFTPEALLAVINHRLGEQPKEKTVLPAPQEPLQEPVISPEEESRKAITAIRAKIAAALEARLEGAEAAGMKEKLGTICEEALDESLLKEVSGLFGKVNPLAGIAAFAGSATAISVGDIVQLISQSNRSGMLELCEGSKRAAVYLKDGRISFARFWGGSEEFLLGRYLLKEELITRDMLERITQQKGTKSLLGERLIKTGLITREDLKKVLEAQTTEVIYEALRWDRAEYTFHPDIQSSEAEASRLQISVGEVLMEGFRRVDEWRLIEKEVKDFTMILTRTGMAAELADRLSPPESLVLDFIDGVRTVRDIIKETKMASFEVCKIIYQLMSMKIVKKVKE
jgi:DNA-binding response OmpR family regulator